jgi:predicted Zn-dependent protease
MEYTNPEIQEGINTTEEHPLKEFLILTFGILGTIIIAVIIISLLAERLAVYVPFSVETEIVPDDLIDVGNDDETRLYLQDLSNQLSRYMDLSNDMNFTLHFSNENTVNAHATLGGHIFIYQGLLDVLPNENVLAMVIAHEMAHVYHRHPIIALGRGVVIGLLLTAISGLSSDYLVGQVVNDAGVITLLTFNRDQERDADQTALAVIEAMYNHVGGSVELFNIFQREGETDFHAPQFLNTHPLSEERIENIQKYATQKGWKKHGEFTTLPEFILQNRSATEN